MPVDQVGTADLPSSLVVEQRGPIAILTLDRVAKRNALDDETVLGFEQFFATLADSVRVVVLNAAGDHFCAGLDLSSLGETTTFEGVMHSRMWHRAFERIESCGVPVISVLRGAVIGGGLELATATHIRVAEQSAFYALPEGKRGLFVGGGASVRVSRLIGAHRVADMMLTGRVLSSDEGHGFGISNYLVENGQGLARALELAASVAENSPITNYAVVTALPRIAAANPTEGFMMEALMAAISQGSDEAKQRMREFLEGSGPPRPAGAGGLVSADGSILWEPAADAREHTRIGAYLRWLEVERSLVFAGYDELWRWSVSDIEAFWDSIWDYFGVESSTPRGEVLAERTMPGAQWFPGTRVNYAGYMVERNRSRAGDVAVVARSQTREPIEYTFAHLEDQVARARAGLVRLGVTKGDRVVAYLPNIPEALVAFLACASIGAIWSSCAPEFGPRSVIDRFAQVEPKVLLAVGGYRYGDKDIDSRPRVAEVLGALDTVQHVVHVPYGQYAIDDAVEWSELTAQASPLSFEPVPFDHPLCILFSSGTTGLPKAIVHGHGGILLEHLKNHALSWDLGPDDRMLWFTTTAWMMWNALVSSLLVGTSIVMLDGNPLHPDLENQWRLAEETGATVMGLSPAFIMACRKVGLEPAGKFDLSRLRSLCAAGSPLPAEGYLWLAEQFGDRAPLNVGSGGTDVCTGIVQGNPLIPVYVGEISGHCLGVNAQSFDDEGAPVVGELGELVITEPMPSMPVAFWGDDDGSRYLSTYFNHYPGIFRFGDWVRFTEHGSSVVTGRSDATLNRGGVRLGTAELYRVIEEFERVEDSVVVHLEDPDGGPGELILFVVLTDGELDESFRLEIVRALRDALSPRHVPDTIVQMPGVPRNLTGKKLELPVKKILQGTDPVAVVSRGAVADPEVLDAYLAYAASRR